MSGTFQWQRHPLGGSAESAEPTVFAVLDELSNCVGLIQAADVEPNELDAPITGSGDRLWEYSVVWSLSGAIAPGDMRSLSLDSITDALVDWESRSRDTADLANLTSRRSAAAERMSYAARELAVTSESLSSEIAAQISRFQLLEAKPQPIEAARAVMQGSTAGGL